MSAGKLKEKIGKFLKQALSWAKLHPSIFVWLIIAVLGLNVQIAIIGICMSPIKIFSIDAIVQVMTTSAEVIAGLYGLTLTGYIFFLDHLQQKIDAEELIEDIIVLLKKRYHNMVLFLSTICFIAIISSFSFIIYNKESMLIPMFIYEFWAYETMLLVFITLLFNVYFIITVVDPDKIPRAGLKYKQKSVQMIRN